MEKIKTNNTSFSSIPFLAEIKLITIIKSLENQITNNLKISQIETRPVGSNGLWCCTLLPSILISYSLLYEVSPLYKLIAYLSIGLVVYSILFIIFMSISCLVLEETIYGGTISSSVTSAIFIYAIMEEGLIFTLMLTIPTVYFYSTILRVALTQLPKTFSVGEAMIVTQGITLFFAMSIVHHVPGYKETNDESNFLNLVIYTVLSTVGLIVTALYMLKDQERTMSTLWYIIIVAGVFGILLLHTVLGPTALLQILTYVFLDKRRMQLFSFWLFLLTVSIFLLYARTQLAVKADTVTRKSFHILAALVFLSGILLEENLMKLAAGIGLGVLVLVEAIRKSGIDPISSSLESAFLVYSDEKDCGKFAMTPVYLYVGLSCPLVLCPTSASTLESLSGVLAIGVGDTAASWGGSRYGVNKWNGSNRTIEGTAFNILAQVATVYVLKYFELINLNYAMTRTAVTALISSLVEAKTDQVDNLILPLVTLLAFQTTTFLN